jgi:hypothetical protein
VSRIQNHGSDYQPSRAAPRHCEPFKRQTPQGARRGARASCRSTSMGPKPIQRSSHALAGMVIPSRLPTPRSRRLLLPGSSVWLRATRRHFRRPASRSSTRGPRHELAIRFALGAGARLLELDVTKTQSSVVAPKVVVDQVQNLYREDLSEDLPEPNQSGAVLTLR